MPLKRGRLRESCCFCHKRKVRCDRIERVAAGKPSCSACSQRGQTCKLEQSQADGRTRASARNNGTRSPSAHVPDPPAQQRRHSLQSATETLGLPSDLSFNEITECPLLRTTVPDQDPYFLSISGVAFLDDIFLGESYSTRWQDFSNAMDSSNANGSLAQIEHIEENPVVQAPITPIEMHTAPSFGNSPTAQIYAQTMEAAISAYFKHVAPVLPILPEKAFWTDYREGISCGSLTLALACRGYPFLEIDNRWHIQQVVARDFRQSLLQSQEESPQSTAIRIDELEGLALMVDFAYQESYQDPNETRFGNLFLSYDSLVLATLQLEQNFVLEELQEPTTNLSSFRERYTMLCWHVFGLDAFNCLERLRPSRIQDNYTSAKPELPVTPAKGYLDAILSLSIIARVIVKSLRQGRAGQAVMTQNYLSDLYQQLETWHKNLAPSQLNWAQTEDAVSPASEASDDITEVHRFTLAMLELNCYMQIENHALRGRQRDSSTCPSLEHEIMMSKIEFETLRAIQRTFRSSRWNKIITNIDVEEPNRISPIDRYPRILRDISAGVCVWLRSRQGKSRGPYEEICRELRAAVASAKSHHDTPQIIATLSTETDG